VLRRLSAKTAPHGELAIPLAVSTPITFHASRFTS
jgi:hypothetical protein